MLCDHTFVLYAIVQDSSSCLKADVFLCHLDDFAPNAHIALIILLSTSDPMIIIKVIVPAM